MRKSKHCTPFGMQVKIKLLEQNMTNRDLARKIGMADSTVCDVIFGRNKRHETREIIADALNIEMLIEEQAIAGEKTAVR